MATVAKKSRTHRAGKFRRHQGPPPDGLTAVLRSSPPMSLHLLKSHLSDADAGKLFQAIVSPTERGLRPLAGLRSLRLQCRFSDDTMNETAFVSAVLRYSSSLRVLDLSRNQMTERGMTELLRSLKLNSAADWPNLEVVDFSYNPIGGASCAKLIEELVPSVKGVVLRHCHINNDGAVQIASALQRRRMPSLATQKQFDAETALRAGRVAATAGMDRPLLQVSLSGNQIGAVGTAALTQAAPPFVSISATRQVISATLH